LSGALGRFGPAGAWAGVIFLLSSLPSPPGAGSVPDWLSHGAAYLVLAALVSRGLRGDAPEPGARRTLAAIALATAYGISDELHQSGVPGRDASAADVAKDLAGATLGALLYAAARRRAAPTATGTAGAAPSAGSPAPRSRGR
jgi:VanZ family protein